jgi:DNA-binding beta-propeller fold protein YncE
MPSSTKEKKMKKMCSLLSVLSLVFIPFLVTAQNVDVTGDWEMTTQSPRGERTQTIHIEQDGENITVTMQGRGGEELTAEGTVKGNKIEWSMTRSTPRGDFTITYTGTVEGDTMSGEAQMGDFGTMEWTAKKK